MVDTINLMLGGCIVIAAVSVCLVVWLASCTVNLCCVVIASQAIGSYVSARLSENIQEEALTRTSSAYKKTA